MEDLSWATVIGWLVLGIVAVWTLARELAPRAFEFWTQAQSKGQDSKIEADADTREFQQQTTGAAINNSILLNEMAFRALVDIIDRYDKGHARDFERLESRITELERHFSDWTSDVNKTLDKVAVHMSRSSTSAEISNRQMAQTEEVISDVDVMFHEIKAILQIMQSK